MVDAAHATALQTIANARAEAAALIESAEHEGESTAELDTERELTSARRRARTILLSAQRQVYDELRAGCANRIRADRRYPRLLQHIADQAQRRLGPGTEVVTGADTVKATRKHRHVQWSLDEAIDRAVTDLGPSVAELWR